MNATRTRRLGAERKYVEAIQRLARNRLAYVQSIAWSAQGWEKRAIKRRFGETPKKRRASRFHSSWSKSRGWAMGIRSLMQPYVNPQRPQKTISRTLSVIHRRERMMRRYARLRPRRRATT